MDVHVDNSVIGRVEDAERGEETIGIAVNRRAPEAASATALFASRKGVLEGLFAALRRV